MTKDKDKLDEELIINVEELLEKRRVDREEAKAIQEAEGDDYDLVFNGEVLRALEEMKKINNSQRVSNIETSKKLTEATKLIEEHGILLDKIIVVNSSMAKEVDRLNDEICELKRGAESIDEE